MPLAGFIHAIILIGEDIFIYLGGFFGVPIWIIITISLLIVIFYYKHIFSLIKLLLGKIGFK